MLDIGINLVPNPNISIEPEYFYAGSEIVGGVFKITLSGSYYADSISDYINKESEIISLNGACRTLSGNIDCGNLISLEGAIGFVESVDVNPGEVLTFQYSIVLSVARDGNNNPIIGRSSQLEYGDIDSTLIVNKYSYEESSSMSPLQKFSIGSSGDLVAVLGKITVKGEIGFYSADRCGSLGIDYPKEIGSWLNGRVYRGISRIPEDFTYILISEKLNVSRTGGSVTKEYYIVPRNTFAIVSVNATNQTDQIMGSTKNTLSGSIEGVRNFQDAVNAYSKIVSHDEQNIKILMGNTCGDAKPLPVDLCRILTSSKRTDNAAKKTINFDFTYDEVERCLTAGYRILTEYTETAPVNKAAEYIIPGKPKPIVFVSPGKTAERKTLKVSSKFTSCNEGFVNTVKGGVTKEFNFQKNALGLNGNYIRLSRSEDEGRYSYSLQEEFIKCE